MLLVSNTHAREDEQHPTEQHMCNPARYQHQTWFRAQETPRPRSKTHHLPPTPTPVRMSKILLNSTRATQLAINTRHSSEHRQRRDPRTKICHLPPTPALWKMSKSQTNGTRSTQHAGNTRPSSEQRKCHDPMPRYTYLPNRTTDEIKSSLNPPPFRRKTIANILTFDS